MDGPSRREMLKGAGVVVVAAAAGFAGFQSLAPVPGTGPAGYPGTTEVHPGSSPAATSDPLAPLSAVPDGGGLVVADKAVVLTREGSTVHAFTAVCTHQGCLVRDVHGGEIHCPCHGSAFDATTGAVVQGQATRALAPVAVAVRDGEVVTT